MADCREVSIGVQVSGTGERRGILEQYDGGLRGVQPQVAQRQGRVEARLLDVWQQGGGEGAGHLRARLVARRLQGCYARFCAIQSAISHCQQGVEICGVGVLRFPILLV